MKATRSVTSKNRYEPAVLLIMAVFVLLGNALAGCSGTRQPVPAATTPVTKNNQTQNLPESVWLDLKLFGEEIHGFAIEGDRMKRAVMDAVYDYLLNSLALPGADLDALKDWVRITIKYEEKDEQSAIYYAFVQDGKHYLQNAEGSTCAPIKEDVYQPLLDLAMGYHLPYALTVRSGANEIRAMPNPIWSVRKADGLNADMRYYTPQQMADYIQYLELGRSEKGKVPFTPYANGKEVFGEYTLYNDKFESIQFILPSGLKPQTYLFTDTEPGRYIVELRATFETEEFKYGYQYFFGVIVK